MIDLRGLALRAVVVTCCLTAACAKQAPPPGGPEDRIAPSVVSTIPNSGSAGVAIDSPIYIRFSEPMQREDVEGAVYVFPAPEAPPELDWDGEVLRIIPDTAWSSDQTYVITLQAEARDRRGNRLLRSLQIAFSTGEQIDSGRIAGRVFRGDTPAPEALALCYRLQRGDLNPELDTADYVVQTDSAGAFEFSFLSPGSYRVFALEDRDRDWLWNTGVELIAVPSSDCAVVGQEDVALPPLFLLPLDTVRPALLSCRALSGRVVRVDLDRASDSAWLAAAVVAVRSETGDDSAEAIYVPDSLADHFFATFRDSVTAGRSLVTLTLPPPWAMSDTCSVTPPSEGEPAPAMELRRIKPDTTGGAVVQPDTLFLEFDQPLLYLNRDRIRAESPPGARLGPAISGPFSVSFAKEGGKILRDSARLAFQQGAVVGEGGAQWPSADSLVLTIALPADDSVGSFEVVFDEASELLPEDLGLAIRQMGRPGSPQWWSVHSTRVAGELLRGDYALYLLADTNGDRRFDPGWPHPYRSSEAMWPLSDTLHIRARFTTELHLDWRSKK